MKFDEVTRDLLTTWCDGLLAHQIYEPDNPTRHGALGCPSCDDIHPRGWEAVYPLFHLAKSTGQRKYLDAGLALVEWSRCVSRPNGAWSNDPSPRSWQGTTIFGAIALAETLHHHSDLVSPEQETEWKARLAHAASDYLWNTFTVIDFTNVNYGLTGIYGFDLIGRVLGEDRYIERARKLAAEVPEYFTEPQALIYGEGKPARNRSAKGLLPVDLGYNVEESINGIALYALEHNDEKMLDLITRSMESHLEFMLPDGAWDNSWGTRQFKWTYWGSRTSDGCQPAFALLASRNPAFGTAAFLNTLLLAQCTHDGLLHGGMHYVSHGVKPCIHHTFEHAKTLAFVLDNLEQLPILTTTTPVPRQNATGVKHFQELDVWLAARGPWRATVSAYDSIYRLPEEPDHILHATGGSLSVLYHERVGMLLSGSMARYILAEPNNQQPSPGPDYALTPRIEVLHDGATYSNLYDLAASVAEDDDGSAINFRVQTTVQDEDQLAPPAGDFTFELEYTLTDSSTVISARSTSATPFATTAALVVPVISATGEHVRHISERCIEIVKPGGTVRVTASEPITITETAQGRTFNMVPGFEALPLSIALPPGGDGRVECTITVRD